MKPKRKKKRKLTNLEIVEKFGRQKFKGRVSKIEAKNLQDLVVKMRAEGKSQEHIAQYLNEHHPKSTGNKWNGENVRNFYHRLKKRQDAINAENYEVSDQVAKAAVDTTKGIQKTNDLLNKWIDKADTQGKIWVGCDKCGHRFEVETFDSDKAVRVAGEIRRTLLAAQKLTGALPDVSVEQTSLNDTLNVKRFIDKLVKENVLIVADAEKLHSYGL
jgi:hypothetical protein